MIQSKVCKIKLNENQVVMYWIVHMKGKAQWIALPNAKTVEGAKLAAGYIHARNWNKVQHRFVLAYTHSGEHPLKVSEGELIIIALRRYWYKERKMVWIDYGTVPIRERVGLTGAELDRAIRENMLTTPFDL